MLIQILIKMRITLACSLSNTNKNRNYVVLAVLALVLSGCSQIMEEKPMESISEISSEIYPLDFDLEEAREKGIGKKEDYLLVQTNYLKYLSIYLNSLYDFKEIDKTLKENDFELLKEQPYYFRISELGSEYVYLRNNIHCERLTEEQITFLKNVQDSDADQGIDLVKNTYIDVLSAKSENFTDTFKLAYTKGSNIENVVENTALVFYINYKTPVFDSNEKESYVEINKKNKLILESISKDVSGVLSEEMGEKIYIFYAGWYPMT